MLGWLLSKYMYLVNMFSSVEDSCLNFIYHSLQSRNAAQRELNETIKAEGGYHAGRVYLPESHVGSPRMQLKLIADSLAIIRRHGTSPAS